MLHDLVSVSWCLTLPSFSHDRSSLVFPPTFLLVLLFHLVYTRPKKNMHQLCGPDHISY